MAGDWIKVEKCSINKPEVMRLARLWGISQDAALGAMIRFWTWADDATVDGVVDGVASQHVDAMMHFDGFAQGLISVGWLIADDLRPCLTIPHFTTHNAETAKKRALRTDRQARWRFNNVDAPPSTTASTREEKRREDIKSKAKTNPLPPLSQPAPAPDCPAGVSVETWESWKRQRGRKLTADAVRLQTRFLREEGLRGSDPNAIIEQSIRNGWAGLFALKTGAVVNGGGNVALHEKRSATAKAMYGDNVGNVGATGSVIEGCVSREVD